MGTDPLCPHDLHYGACKICSKGPVLTAELTRLRARIAELERRKPAESPYPTASGFPDP